MTRDEILKDFLSKSVLPIVLFGIVFPIFKTYYTIGDEVLTLNIWIYCGIPFGVWQMFTWMSPSKFEPRHRFGAVLFNIIFGSVLGSFFMVGKLAKALWYIPLSLIRLLQSDNGTGKGRKMRVVC